MTTILGHPLSERGYETIAVDMPTFGLTEVAPGAIVTYDDWVRIGADLVELERARDDRPIVLYGLSMRRHADLSRGGGEPARRLRSSA